MLNKKNKSRIIRKARLENESDFDIVLHPSEDTPDFYYIDVTWYLAGNITVYRDIDEDDKDTITARAIHLAGMDVDELEAYCIAAPSGFPFWTIVK